MKRCSYRYSKSSHQVTFFTPQRIGKFTTFKNFKQNNVYVELLFKFSGRFIYTVYIMSDSYIGFDQQYNIHLDVIEALKIEDDYTDSSAMVYYAVDK